MCSIVGYVGNTTSQHYVLQGLERLEYRGYDSSGYAWIRKTDNHLMCVKSVGNVNRLKEQLTLYEIGHDNIIGIGHTRWATHGVATEKNAHPHLDCFNHLAVVHNGIIENHHTLKKTLLATHQFNSDTDTEIIAHLFEELLSQYHDLTDASKQLVNMLDGAYACLIMMQSHPDTLVAIRKKSPLCIGIGTQGNHFIASDPFAFHQQTNRVIFMPDESFAIINLTTIALFNFAGEPLTPVLETLPSYPDNDEKHGHQHYMLKEIYEQKKVISTTAAETIDQLPKIIQQLSSKNFPIEQINSIKLIGCGTSWHAAHIARFFFETIAQIPTRVELASEFRYQSFLPTENSLYIAISQSGETADTLEALRFLKKLNQPCIAVSNVALSTIIREADAGIVTSAGREIAVASTKAFTTQISSLYVLAYSLARAKKLVPEEAIQEAKHHLYEAATGLSRGIDFYAHALTQTIAPHYARYPNMIFLGRNITYPLALEAALKFKELTYQFACAEAGGELKHGSLALIDAETPVIILTPQDHLLYQKLLNNAQEIKARNGHIIAFAYEHQKELLELADQSFIIPPSAPLLEPITMAGILQLFIYHIAHVLNRPIDKPRNLAKSVTVE